MLRTPNFMTRSIPFLTGAVLLAVHGRSFAQDPQEPPQRMQLGGYDLSAKRAVGRAIGDDTVILLSGNVRFVGEGIVVQADRVMTWMRLGEKQPFRKMYVEGNFFCRRWDEKTQRWQSYSADRLFYDFVERKGVFHNFTARLYSGKHRTPIHLNAREARLISQPSGDSSRDRIIAIDVTVSTCTYGEAHYSVRFADAEVDLGEASPRKAGPLDLWSYDQDGWKFTGTGTAINVWGVSMPFFPVVLAPAAVSALPIRQVQSGQTSRFGYHVETDWGVRLSKGVGDALNPWDGSGPDDDREEWGDLAWEIDWRRFRGWAFGFDPSWKRNGLYHGYVDTYYLRDRGPRATNVFDQKFLPLVDPDRARARLFHRHEIFEDVRLELEVSWLSDRNMLEEFFEEEFKTGKEQETVGYVRWRDGNSGAFVLQRNRINDFQTQLEYLPLTRFFLFDEPLAPSLVPGLTVSQEVEAVQLRQKRDEQLMLEEPHTWRVDSLSTVLLPLRLGVATLLPFAEGRMTGYETTLDGNSEGRLIGTVGGRITSEWTGIYDCWWEFIGLHRLRHIIQLEGRYGAALVNTLDSALFPYDAVDGLDEFEEITVKMRHRFQTKVPVGDRMDTVEFLELGVQAEYYPRAERDTLALNPNNFTYPFHWISLAPPFDEERRWSNIHWDALFQPSKYFAALASGEYNPVLDREEVREIAFRFAPSPALLLSAGQVFVADVTNAFAVNSRWAVTEKWKVTAELQFDFKTGDYISRKATVGRDFHDFLFELIFEEDVGREERKYYFTFVPTFLRLGKQAADAP
ncbi:MAG: hypothetical protein HY716_10240 [Planctomycetes bacterium]|nr:hypothetical protein [Planctomycetota bacterium]